MITIIAAIAANRAIGLNNKLLYWLPNDLKRFKALTTGHTIIMGRRTYESLPKGALPNRRNVVLTRMSERLTDDVDENGDPKRKIFRDSLVDNAVEICGLLKSFNITGDMRMDEMRKQLEDALRHVDAQTLRDSDHVRLQTKLKVDTLLSKF